MNILNVYIQNSEKEANWQFWGLLVIGLLISIELIY